MAEFNPFDPEEWSINGDCLWGGYLNKDATHALIAQFYDNDKAGTKEMIDFVLRACRSYKSLLALLERRLPIIEREAESRERAGRYEGEYWTEMRDLANEISAEIDRAKGLDRRDLPNAETCPHGFGFTEYCPDCKRGKGVSDGRRVQSNRGWNQTSA